MSPLSSPRNETIRKFEKRVNITEFSRTSPPNMNFLDLSPPLHFKKEIETKNKNFLENDVRGEDTSSAAERGLRKIEVKKNSRPTNGQTGASNKEDNKAMVKPGTSDGSNGNLFRITSGNNNTNNKGAPAQTINPRIISFDDLITNKQLNLESEYEGIENLGIFLFL